MRQRVTDANRRIKVLEDQLAANLVVEGTESPGNVDPTNIVWIFGTARVGSTWLSRMMGDLGGYAVWREPLVGTLFGRHYYVGSGEFRRNDKDFILGRHKRTWLNSIRSFVLEGASARFPETGVTDYLVIKEPNGSVGAPLMMEALPESRMILLVRDPRDVVASALDARREGSWRKKTRVETDRESKVSAVELARNYLQNVGNSKAAYDAHEGPKVLVRYEELRVDSPGTVRRICSELGVPLDEEKMIESVEKHSWENIPDQEKGTGKFYRKATPGAWREDLTLDQIQTIERVTDPLLKELYPA